MYNCTNIESKCLHEETTPAVLARMVKLAGKTTKRQRKIPVFPNTHKHTFTKRLGFGITLFQNHRPFISIGGSVEIIPQGQEWLAIFTSSRLKSVISRSHLPSRLAAVECTLPVGCPYGEWN